MYSNTVRNQKSSNKKITMKNLPLTTKIFTLSKF